MAFTLERESGGPTGFYTWVPTLLLQPLVFDLLPTKDGLYRDGDNVATGSDSSSTAPRHDICLTADHPAEWERIRYLPLPKVLEELQTETKVNMN